MRRFKLVEEINSEPLTEREKGLVCDILNIDIESLSHPLPQDAADNYETAKEYAAIIEKLGGEVWNESAKWLEAFEYTESLRRGGKSDRRLKEARNPGYSKTNDMRSHDAGSLGRLLKDNQDDLATAASQADLIRKADHLIASHQADLDAEGKRYADAFIANMRAKRGYEAALQYLWDTILAGEKMRRIR